MCQMSKTSEVRAQMLKSCVYIWIKSIPYPATSKNLVIVNTSLARCTCVGHIDKRHVSSRASSYPPAYSPYLGLEDANSIINCCCFTILYPAITHKNGNGSSRTSTIIATIIQDHNDDNVNQTVSFRGIFWVTSRYCLDMLHKNLIWRSISRCQVPANQRSRVVLNLLIYFL